MRTPSNAIRAFALANTLNESAYRRRVKFRQTLDANESGGFPPSTIHGGGGRGGTPSDPTANAAINPHADPARVDRGVADGHLLQAARLLRQVDDEIARTLGRCPLDASIPGQVVDLPTFELALNAIGYLIDRGQGMWMQYHHAAGNTLDRHQAYDDLRDALELLWLVDVTMCVWLKADPVRVHCANQLCPDRNPPAIDCLRCWACDRYLRRYNEERTRSAEQARTFAAA